MGFVSLHPPYGADTLLLLGHATGGVILSTVRYAADADYELIVVEDCCADRDHQVPTFLKERTLRHQAAVAGSAEVIKAIYPGS